MRILIIHPEAGYFAGAEKLLEYFLGELAAPDCMLTVAAVRGSRVAKLLPPKATPVWIEENPAFSPGGIWRQAQALRRLHAESPFDIIHGWAARDWELATLTGWLCRRPAIGTLHDHPEAAFISGKRRRLMRWCANHGLKKIICVSSAVQTACVHAGYAASKLTVVHNGLPAIADSSVERLPGPFRIGFLGAFSERKGLRDFFKIVDKLESNGKKACEWHLAGNAQDEEGARLMEELRNRYETKGWWKNLRWHGWVESPQDFVRTIDLLIVPSSEFEPFGLVVAEAGQAGVPVLAARVGGVPEIVEDGRTGWLFEPGDVEQATRLLTDFLAQPAAGWQMGGRARERVVREFSAAKMVAGYREIYSALVTDV